MGGAIVEVPTGIKNGVIVEIDNAPHQVLSFDSKKVGKGIAKTTMQVKNLFSGANVVKAFNSGTKLPECDIETKEATYSYSDPAENKFFFMDSETFEEIEMSGDSLGEVSKWLADGQELSLQLYEGVPVNIRFTKDIIMEIDEITTSKGRESNDCMAVLSNGIQLKGPGYLKKGDKVVINPRHFTITKRAD